MSVIPIVYPLALPTRPAPTDTEINLDYRVGFGQSPFSYASQSHDWGGRIWRAKVNLAPCRRASGADDWLVFFSLMRGRGGYCKLGDWDRRQPRGTISGALAVDGGGQTGNALLIKGCTPGTTWLKGSHLEIEDRLYRLVADFTASAGSGGGSIAEVVIRGFGSFGSIADVVTRGFLPAGSAGGIIQIEPNLRAAPVDSSVITYVNPKGLFRLAQNYVPSPSDANGVHRFSFEMFEKL